jgi:hypothetical protein
MKKEAPHFISLRRSSVDMGTLRIKGFPCLSTTCHYMMLRLVCGVYYECNQDYRKCCFFFRETETLNSQWQVWIYAFLQHDIATDHIANNSMSFRRHSLFTKYWIFISLKNPQSQHNIPFSILPFRLPSSMRIIRYRKSYSATQPAYTI